MKTMKLGNELPIRVKEDDVIRKLADGYKFCPRSEWKKFVRDDNKNEKKEKVVELETNDVVETKKPKKTKKKEDGK